MLRQTEDELIEGLSENVNIKTQKTLIERFCEVQFYMKRFYSLWPEAKLSQLGNGLFYISMSVPSQKES